MSHDPQRDRVRRRMLLAAGLLALLGAIVAGVSALRLATDSSSIETTWAMSAIPATWARPPYNMVWTRADAREAAGAKAVFDRELAQYPDGFVERYMSRIAVVESLDYDGVVIAGTYGYTERLIVVALEAYGRPIEAPMLARIMHHELSSLLYHRHQDRFPHATWNAARSPEVGYGEGGLEELRKGWLSTGPSEELMPSGFYSEYSRASVEEDFNVIADALWCGDAAFWEMSERYEYIRTKRGLVIGFYESLDSSLDDGFFRRLRDR